MNKANRTALLAHLLAVATVIILVVQVARGEDGDFEAGGDTALGTCAVIVSRTTYHLGEFVKSLFG